MKNNFLITMTVLPLLLAGCASTGKPEIPLGSDPRIGAEVRQVCFARNIDSWSDVDNDRNAVIIKMRSRDYYKLKISGGCDPQWAISTIAVITRGGSCYTRGDRIKTDADPSQGYGSSCVITAINKWDPDAAKQAEQQTEIKSPPAR